MDEVQATSIFDVFFFDVFEINFFQVKSSRHERW